MNRFDRESIGTYPQPNFRRENWQDLNGVWEFDFDDDDRGMHERWQEQHIYSRTITVPFCYQSRLSGLHDLTYHPYVWYRRTFQYKLETGSLLLHFGAVDYRCKVWINGQFAGEHIGGHTSFWFDISLFVHTGENELVLRAEDTGSCQQPRGKQVWHNEEPTRCWYTPTTGIWQNVWLEYTGHCYTDLIHITPDPDNRCAQMFVRWPEHQTPDQIHVRVWRGETVVADELRACSGDRIRLSVAIPEQDPVYDLHCWSPKHPTLYDVEITLFSYSRQEDTVYTYFGMRKIECRNGLILLNNKPIYQKLILDQGYWPDSLLTPPDLHSLRDDLALMQAMGFNGVRKHQKIEDPRFYYWADVFGMLVWEEMPSFYEFTERSVEHFLSEWREAISRDYNHPSVITWVPFNESWGLRNIYSSKQQQDFAASVYYLTKTIDNTRLVQINDGWEQLSVSDLCGIHDYRVSSADMLDKYRNLTRLLKQDAAGTMLYCQGSAWQGQPVILSEFGGISCGAPGSWGYHKHVAQADALVEQYGALVKALRAIPDIQGFCYTQFTDVMQEMNGLLYADHTPKIDIRKIAAYNT